MSPIHQYGGFCQVENKQETCVTPDEFGTSFLKGLFTQIYKQKTKDFKQLITMDDFTELGTSFNQGVEKYNLEMRTNLNAALTQYIWLDNAREKAIRVVFDKNNMIHGLILSPFVSYPESDQRYTKNTYIMPVKGEWFVFWGGINQFVNYHYVYETQRYAYDLIMMKDGQSYHGDMRFNENYYAFNKEIVAPANGKVVKVVDGIMDNVVGELNADEPEGNFVLIEHKNNEYSMLAHFKQNTILVKEGEFVKQGQLIGRCGNSGNSSEPHIHFQVTDALDYTNGRSIRIFFENGLEPIQGDYVSE